MMFDLLGLIFYSALAFADTANCRLQVLDEDSFVITSVSDGSKLFVAGHRHKMFSEHDKYHELIQQAALVENDPKKLKEQLKKIVAWDGYALRFYGFFTGWSNFEKLEKAIKTESIDFLGLEHSFDGSRDRLKQVAEDIKVYRRLVKKSGGNSKDAELDLIGMLGPDWYVAASENRPAKVEGVESVFFLNNFVDADESLRSELAKMRDIHDPKTKALRAEILSFFTSADGTLAQREQLLRKAKTEMNLDLFAKIESIAALRDNVEKTWKGRNLNMLSHMKARTKKVGFLFVGKMHIFSMKRDYNVFCDAKRIDYPMAEKIEGRE